MATFEKTHTRRLYQSGSVICKRCGAPVNVFKLEALNREFALNCLKCGHRAIYDKAELNIAVLPDRRKKPR